MYTFDEVSVVLDEIAEELPEAFYSSLSGGVYLLPDAVTDDESDEKDPLYILGEYINDYDFSGYINIYYGSFMEVFPNLPPDELKRELKQTLIHEFTHHMESLAGERGLDIKDELEMERYRRSLETE